MGINNLLDKSVKQQAKALQVTQEHTDAFFKRYIVWCVLAIPLSVAFDMFIEGGFLIWVALFGICLIGGYLFEHLITLRHMGHVHRMEQLKLSPVPRLERVEQSFVRPVQVTIMDEEQKEEEEIHEMYEPEIVENKNAIMQVLPPLPVTIHNEVNLPTDIPENMFATLNEALRNRGGMFGNQPNFWIESVQSTPFFWLFGVEYNAARVDPEKLSSFSGMIEDRLTRIGYDYNVRIQERPYRIEIDKSYPPTVLLLDLWNEICLQKVDERMVTAGIAYRNGKQEVFSLRMTGEDFSGFIAANSGGGKTQLAMCLVLSMAMTNSPQRMSFIIIDPKAIDFIPFGVLPHLSRPVITDPNEAVEVIDKLVFEMDKRRDMAAKEDNSFLKNAIFVYIDELADLFASLSNKQQSRLADNLQRLGQKGRAYGIMLLGATQRVYEVPVNVHSKLSVRFVGKTRTAGDSVAASGIPGTKTNKLPGRGSFQIFSSRYDGLRIQGAFVADSLMDNYKESLNPFFASIIQRWQGVGPGWLPERSRKESGDTYDEVVETLQKEYENDPDSFCLTTVRTIYSQLNGGARLSSRRERELFDLAMDTELYSE